MMTAEANLPTYDNPHRARLAAIRLQSSRKRRIETDLAAAKKRFKDELTEATQEFNALLPEHEADLPDDARERLVDLFKAFQERKEVEATKKRELDSLTKKLKASTARLWELVDSEVEDTQVSMALGDTSLADGLGVSKETARELYIEIREVESAGGKLDGDTADLKRRLEAQGFTAMTLDDEPGEDDAANDAEEEPRKLGEPARDNLAVVQ
jgi:hypothetical protein